ncbi:MAG: hypothetical protein AAF645_16940 [Myxococcota bacterium]
MNVISDLSALEAILDGDADLRGRVLYALDLRQHAARVLAAQVEAAVFIGCELERACLAAVVERGALVFPRLPHGKWDIYRRELYTPEELFDGFDPADPCSYCDTLDARVWRHWRDHGGSHPTDLLETLSRRLHDHAVYEAMRRTLTAHPRVVAVMGGHSMKRGTPEFASVARMARLLAERGFFIATGGGPGAMEAAHLGVWFTGRPDEELDAAIAILADAPHYKDRDFLSAAFRVRERFPYGQECPPSLGVPTWLYGHEPPNPFARYIAKFFANSVREDGLVSIATHGIVFAPGSAGTIQEIFQDAAQNHYGTVRASAAPMVFLGETYWRAHRPVYPLLASMAAGRPYASLITIGDSIEALARFIEDHPPVHVDGSDWSVCGLHCSEKT